MNLLGGLWSSIWVLWLDSDPTLKNEKSGFGCTTLPGACRVQKPLHFLRMHTDYHTVLWRKETHSIFRQSYQPGSGSGSDISGRSNPKSNILLIILWRIHITIRSSGERRPITFQVSNPKPDNIVLFLPDMGLVFAGSRYLFNENLHFLGSRLLSLIEPCPYLVNVIPDSRIRYLYTKNTKVVHIF